MKIGIITWDWKDRVDRYELKKLIRAVKCGKNTPCVTEVEDTGGDCFAMVVSSKQINEEQAQKIFNRYCKYFQYENHVEKSEIRDITCPEKKPEKKKNKKLVKSGFRLLVNYNLRLETAIRDGEYDEVDEIGYRHFRTNRTGQKEVEMKFFRFNQEMSSEEVIEEMCERGYRPAELRELLAFGAKCSDKQRKYLIVELGSVWRGLDGDREVAYLCSGACGRSLGVGCFDDDWYVDYRFLAVRES